MRHGEANVIPEAGELEGCPGNEPGATAEDPGARELFTSARLSRKPFRETRYASDPGCAEAGEPGLGRR
jgi:hypothetical protein